MGITIDFPGLKDHIKEIPNGHMILIQGQLDPIKTYFVMHLGCIGQNSGRKVTFITSKEISEVKEQFCHFDPDSEHFEILDERSSRHWKDHIDENSILIIDSFSYLMLDKSIYEFRDVLEDMRTLCKQKNANVLLTIVDGMLDEKHEIIVGYLADGIISFLTREASKGIARYMRFPKWMGRLALDRDINYTFDGKKMSVDLRSRVV